jgi:predicted naringenin-chalcone synthase
MVDPIMTGSSAAPMPVLSHFSRHRPEYETSQARSLQWLAELHAEAQSTASSLDGAGRSAFHDLISRAIDRYACGPAKIGWRGHVVPDVGSERWDDMAIYDVRRDPHGHGAGARCEFFADAVSKYFDAEYEFDDIAPADLVHVTCTGYASPSGAQRLVQRKRWGDATRVTHAYHMGCYAAFPATRLAVGYLRSPAGLSRSSRLSGSSVAPGVDVVHTEISSLHLNPIDHSAEQLVVQSLFADGFIRYSVRDADGGPGLRILAITERTVPDTLHCMTWAVSDWGMKMTLARDVPGRIASALRDAVIDLFRKADMSLPERLSGAIFAVHPGGPRIIDRVREVLELDERQVEASREILFRYGNMSSATLPHVWMKVVDDEDVPAGTLVVSLAFGPGLTICASLFQKL